MNGRGSNRFWPVRPARWVAVAAAVLALAWATAAPASAHNELKSTSPASGATVDRTPSEVVLTFNEPALALGTVLRVTGPTGAVQTGPPVLVDEYVRQPLQAGAAAGRYVVAWRVTSTDGHPVSGSFSFTSRRAGSGTPVSTSPVPPGPAGGLGGTPGWVLAVGGALLVGLVGGVLRAVSRRRGGRQGG